MVVLAALGVAVALSLLAYLAYRGDIVAARLRVVSESQVAQTPCGPIEYAIRGEGPAVLVIHGAGGGYDQGQDIAGPLVSAGFRVISMSRFGYLRTPFAADASPPAQARAHACLLDALNVPKAAIIGASAGTTSALQFALLFPERATRLVLVVPALYVPRPEGAPSVTMPAGVQFIFETALRSDFLFWAAIRAAPKAMVRTILATPPALLEKASAEERARVATLLDHVLPVTSRRLGLVNDASVSSSLTRYELERVAVPTLVISARDDLFGTWDSARYTAEHIPGARFVGYPSGGHVLVGRASEELAEVSAFLR